MQGRPGDRVDRYTLVKLLGSGGQGSVWKVIDPLDGGVVRALKLIDLQDASPAASERARREAKAVAQAKHPSLIPCRMLFEDPQWECVGLVFDFVRGKPLHEAASDPRMTKGHRFAAIEQIALTLEYIHSLGIVHRDLKLDNVLVTEHFWDAPGELGTVKLLDFGVAAPAVGSSRLTATGAVIGTLPYMAPELLIPQIGESSEGFSRDLFAFGVLAWSLLFGQHPTGLAAEALVVAYIDAYKAAAKGQIPWPPRGLEGSWNMAIGACLALTPDKRPATGKALMEMLKADDTPLRASAVEATTAPHCISTAPMGIVSTSSTPPTEPMPAPEPRAAPSVAVASGSTVVENRPAHQGNWRRTLRRILVLALVGALAALVWLVLNGHLLTPSQEAHEARLMTTLVPVVPLFSAQPTQRTCSSPCCGGSLCMPDEQNAAKLHLYCERGATSCKPCASGHSCVPGKCTDDLQEQSWRLRLAGLEEQQVYDKKRADVAKTRPSAQVCVKLSKTAESPICMKLSDAVRPSEAKKKWLLLTTKDLLKGGIDIDIQDAEKSIARRKGASHLKITKTVLCRGFSWRVEDFTVTFYLDHPNDP